MMPAPLILPGEVAPAHRVIGGEAFGCGPKDVFVCPSWMPCQLEADEQAVLFSYSDRPVPQARDLWREAL